MLAEEPGQSKNEGEEVRSLPSEADTEEADPNLFLPLVARH